MKLKIFTLPVFLMLTVKSFSQDLSTAVSNYFDLLKQQGDERAARQGHLASKEQREWHARLMGTATYWYAKQSAYYKMEGDDYIYGEMPESMDDNSENIKTSEDLAAKTDGLGLLEEPGFSFYDIDTFHMPDTWWDVFQVETKNLNKTILKLDKNAQRGDFLSTVYLLDYYSKGHNAARIDEPDTLNINKYFDMLLANLRPIEENKKATAQMMYLMEVQVMGSNIKYHSGNYNNKAYINKLLQTIATAEKVATVDAYNSTAIGYTYPDYMYYAVMVSFARDKYYAYQLLNKFQLSADEKKQLNQDVINNYTNTRRILLPLFATK